MSSIADPIKAWLAQFLFVRGHFKGPTGQALYKYQVEAAEYADLAELLRRHQNLQNYKSWASAFCLFVAERFRRGYDGSDEGWSWIPIERELNCSFTLAGRAAVVEKGLQYWKRPIRQHEDRRHLLGSLFLEGGLPWPLVQNDRHGFGRAVRRGLKYHYRTDGGRISTADLIADVEDGLPKAFQNLDTRHLLAGVVEQLMALVSHYPITNVADPAGYLDSRDKHWREAFPIPLDENNARTLINDWLRDADKSNRERKEALARERDFSCAHRLIGEPEDWKILTEVTLPVEEVVSIDIGTLRGTRLAEAFYEGEALVRRGRVAYGRLENGKLIVPYSIPSVVIERRDLAEPISLRLSESGHVVHSHTFDGSQLDLAEAPLVFESRAEQWWLAAMASCQLASPVIRVRLPEGTVIASGTIQDLGVDSMGGRWVEATGNLEIQVGIEKYHVRLRSECGLIAPPQLKGDLYPYESTPSIVYLGKPLLNVPEQAGYERGDLVEFENGQTATAATISRAGTVRYTVRTRMGETIFVRRFGVLPKGFRIQSYPATERKPTTFILHNAQQLDCRVIADGVSATVQPTDNALRVEVICRQSQPPPHVNLELASHGQRDPVVIRVAYPFIGARLFDAMGQVTQAHDLTIDDLLGTRLTLLSTRPQDFYLVFKLIASGSALKIQRYYRVRVTDQPVSVGLFAYLQDIRQMLGCVSEQHATVRFQVETDREWLRLDISRYSGYLDETSCCELTVRDARGRQLTTGADIEAMSVVDPARDPVLVPERLSEGVGTGVFVLPTELEQNGPWILYPTKRSAMRFAPRLHPRTNPTSDSENDIPPLQLAVCQYHPDRNPLAIDPHMAAMETDLDSSGWQYLYELRKRFAHMPLSTFATWLALARNEATLAVALIRLELDQGTCHRMRDELAVIWESIPLDTWIAAFECARTWLQTQGLQAEYVQHFLNQRAQVLDMLVPAFAPLRSMLVTGDRERLPLAAYRYMMTKELPEYRDRLRRDHSDDDRWPEDLGQQLTNWASRQTLLPPEIRSLANIEYARAVIYAPVFMAFVTAGKASLADLSGPPAYIKFAVRTLSEYDWRGWYLPVHERVLFYLMAQDDQRN